MSKIKCMYCENIYHLQQGACSACGKRGGYMQEPKSKQFDEINLHLEEVLEHKESKNTYQIKEIQANGLIAVLKSSPLFHEQAKAGMKVYIGNATLSEYIRK